MNTRTKLMISADYELFFGSKAGTVERCLLAPTEALAACAESAGYRLCLFVDAGFLRAARTAGARSHAARTAYDAVARQLRELAARGHDLQLHIHPHWEDSTLVDGDWVIRTERYRLHDFADDEIRAIVRSYKESLEEVADAPVFAYRAGGWCLQPFARLAAPLSDAGIWLDSTVYAGGFSEVPGREYDFRGAPTAGEPYRFDEDPLRPAADGRFLEIPISACRYGTKAFWNLAWRRVFTRPEDKAYGDGTVMPATSRYYLRRLLAPTISPVSFDRSKAGLLGAAFRQFSKQQARPAVFNVMGHPKSVTPRGIAQIGQFLRDAAPMTEPVTCLDFQRERPTPAARIESAGKK